MGASCTKLSFFIVARPIIKLRGEVSKIISVNYPNEHLNKINTFEIEAIILDTSPLDLIIGRATIKKLSLGYCRIL